MLAFLRPNYPPDVAHPTLVFSRTSGHYCDGYNTPVQPCQVTGPPRDRFLCFRIESFSDMTLTSFDPPGLGPFAAFRPEACQSPPSPRITLSLSFSHSFSLRVSHLLRNPPLSFVSESSFLPPPIFHQLVLPPSPRDPVAHPCRPQTRPLPLTRLPVFNAIADDSTLHLESPRR